MHSKSTSTSRPLLVFAGVSEDRKYRDRSGGFEEFEGVAKTGST